jgi:hypothetical protein
MEIWKKVNEFYQVSNLGRIISHKFSKEKILKPGKHSGGYQRIDMRYDGKTHRFLIHRIVAQAFIPNPLNKPEVNHLNGNKQDNNDWNLIWSTSKENTIHSINILGNSKSGEKHPLHMLTRIQINEIRKKYATGNYSYKQLGKEYSVTYRHIGQIIRLERWKMI